MYDVVIIGSGPAGLTAAIYTTRASLKTLVIAGTKWGGQLMLTTSVENFPGFPSGIQGPELMLAMRQQAEHHGADFMDEDVLPIDFTNAESAFTISTASNTYTTRSILIATGADTKWLQVPGEKERIGKGVSSCAPCDAPFFKGKEVVVVGGGDSAMEEALVLTSFATHVTILYRGESLRASQIMQEKVKNNTNITVRYNREIVEIFGNEKVEKIIIKNNKENATEEMNIQGIFVAIGHIPNTSLFKGISCDDHGYIISKDATHTNIEGVFVAGDVYDTKYMQAITAAGFGCMAALDIQHWLRNK